MFSASKSESEPVLDSFDGSDFGSILISAPTLMLVIDQAPKPSAYSVLVLVFDSVCRILYVTKKAMSWTELTSYVANGDLLY